MSTTSEQVTVITRTTVRNLTEIAVEGWLSGDLLRRDVGIFAGILTNCPTRSRS